uniref:PKD-like domain-containing protein n=1 Tax=Pseudopedobacter sp. TaxID=1936787 RepID=UPI00333FCB67
MIRQLYLFIIGLFFAAYNVSAQGIVINHDAVSPYTPGSTIAVLVEISNTTCIRPGNKFGLYLSDATGSFINETQIGTFDGFYTTFINGVIPASAVVGTGYRLRVKSTLPALVSNSSGAFEISSGAAVSANITSSYINPSNTDIFGLCSGINNHTFYLSNESTVGSSVIASVKNELNDNIAAQINFDAQVKPFVAQLAHYTIYVSARMSNGTIGTKAYMIINNRTLTAFGTSGNNTVCLPNAVLDFNVTVSGTDGIENNFPGNIYRINWGDGQENLYTFCDIKNSNGKMSHEYTENSCGRTIVSGSSSVYNAFGVNISTFNSYCGDVGTPVSTFAKVINKPQNDFTNSGACLNQPAVFTNTSIPGQDPNSTASGCGNNAVTYTWYVDGQVVPGAINRPISFPLTYTFTTPGKHVVRLESSSNTACPAEAKEDTVCVQEPPRPSFTINGNSTGSTVCANTILKPVNTSFTDNTCGTNTYNWAVSGGNVVFENNTGTTSAEPEIKFVQPGVYKIRLTINSSACTAVSTEEYTLVVNNIPTVSLSPDLTSCNLSSYNFNNTTSGPTRVEFSGTAEPQSNTYTWTVTGGAYAFIGGTGQNSKFPVIDFTEYATYTITVTHQNNCGTVSAVQNITFEPAPTVNAGTYDAICFTGSVNLNGTINGTVNSFEWVGGMGVFLPDRNTLNANYTPTEAERQSGRVDLTLRATTNLASPCNVVEGFTTINIIAPNRITSEASKNICTANQVDYMPIATVTGSTFSWTATGSANASGFSAGSGTIITDRLVNDSNSSSATVTYTITPFYEGCTGEPFNLTVIVMPKPAVTVTAESTSICSGQKVVIRLSPSIPNTTYTWISSVSDPLISGNSETSIALSITQIEDILFNKSATAGTVTYQITPISSDGCAGDTESISITVKAGAPNTISTNQTICEGTAPVALTGNIPTGGDGPYTYQWQLSTDNGVSWANIMGAESEGYSPPVLNVTIVYRRVVNSFSCPGSVPNYSNEITITVSPDAEAAFNFLADKGCAPFLLDNNNIKAVSYPDRNGNYIWYVDDIQIGTGINFPGYTINEGDDTVTVKLVVTSSLGCKQAEMSHDFITQKTLLSAFTQDKTEGCGPLDVNFTNTSSPMLNTTFFWDFGNGQTSAQIQPGTITFLPDPGGKDKLYTVTLTASSACSPAVVYTSTVLVRAKPLSVFSPDRTISC